MYILTKLELKIEKCSKHTFQKLNIKLKINQVRFFDYIIIFRSMKMLAHIADLRLCALMSCELMSAPLCQVTVYDYAYDG